MGIERSSAYRRRPATAVTTTFFIVGLATLVSGGATPSDRVSRLLRGPGIVNHPVNIIPTSAITIPEGWKLSSDGSITCLTCHTRLPDADGGKLHYLRDSGLPGAESTEFCAKCHGHSTARTARGMHWMALGTAHLKYAGGESRKANSLLDPESRRCMGCHDGVSARESDNPTPGNSGFGAPGDRHRSHPVGVSYGRRSRGGSPVRLRPSSALPKQVHLPGGQVSCLSCHDLYAAERNRLTVSTDDSALCFTCHDMD